MADLTKEELNAIIADFILKRQIIEIPREEIFDSAKWWTDQRKVRSLDYVAPFMLWDPVTRTAPQAFDSSGNLRVTEKGALRVGPVSAGSETATITLTERLEIVGLHADANMAAIAVDRIINIVITVPVIESGVILRVVDSTPITLSTDQNGAFFFPAGPSHWANDNTTITRVANENPFPMIFESGSAFQIVSDNDQVGDLMGIELWSKPAGSP